MRAIGGLITLLLLLGAVVCGALSIRAANAEVATWYGVDDDSSPRIERHNPQACADYPQATCTCAHRRWPIGTHLNVTYRDRSVVCRVNDGLGASESSALGLILSYGAARVLGLSIESDYARVSVRRMGRLE